VAAHGAKYVSTTLVFPFDGSGSCTCVGLELDDSERCLAGRPADIAEPPAAHEGRLFICQDLHGRLSNNRKVRGGYSPSITLETRAWFWKQ
jgi:hypothetical protein